MDFFLCQALARAPGNVFTPACVASVFRALVGVNKRAFRATAPHGHQDRIEGEFVLRIGRLPFGLRRRVQASTGAAPG